VGFWLYKQRRREGVKPAEQARRLGVTVRQLISLSLCKTPRRESFAEDNEVVTRHCGVAPTLLADLIKREWTLAQWRQADSPSGTLGLRAASEADQESAVPEDDDETP
jgi:hypothetical protein